MSEYVRGKRLFQTFFPEGSETAVQRLSRWRGPLLHAY